MMDKEGANVPALSLPIWSDRNPQDWPRKRVTPNRAKMEMLNRLL